MIFSVIIPVYKVEAYLEQCIDSVLAQTFKDYEIILVDDGSPDRCPEICDSYAEKYDFIKVIHKENGGLSDARNAGTPQASGKYIVYIDSDDYIGDENFFEELNEKVKSEPDIILYKFRKYYEKENKFQACGYRLDGMDKFEGMAEIINELSRRDAFYCSAWSKAVKRTLLADNQIFFKKGILGEDIEWYYHVLTLSESMEFLDNPVIVYRQRENSITSSGGEKNLSDNLTTLEYWSNNIKNMQADEEFKKALMGSMSKLYSNLLINYSRADKWRNKYKKRISALSYLLKGSKNPRAAAIGRIYNIIGFRGTIVALKVMDRIKH